MNVENVKLLAAGSGKMSGGLGVSTLVMAYFQANAAGIGAICTVITCLAYIYFENLSSKKDSKDKEEIKKLTEDVEELKDQLSGVSQRKKDNETSKLNNKVR